jgi:hypothetical protein
VLAEAAPVADRARVTSPPPGARRASPAEARPSTPGPSTPRTTESAETIFADLEAFLDRERGEDDGALPVG